MSLLYLGCFVPLCCEEAQMLSSLLSENLRMRLWCSNNIEIVVTKSPSPAADLLLFCFGNIGH